MRVAVEATAWLKEGEGEEIKVQRIRDGRPESLIPFYFVVKTKRLTIFVEPESMDDLIKALENARAKKTFDDVLK